LAACDFKKGFWYYRPEEGFPPPSIREPEHCSGLSEANIVCTQTNLPPRQQAALVERWCEALPTLLELEILWFQCKVPQALFDAACLIPNLRGLYVKWSGIKRIDALAGARQLRFFRLGSSSQVESIDPLTELRQLVWLELENIKRISDLAPLSALQALQGLAVEGSMWSTQRVESLAPLGQLRELRYLNLANLRARDKTLSALYSLSALQTLRVANWWREEELRELRRRNPTLTY
jgi:Leucine-rich repeat (LRR) protein